MRRRTVDRNQTHRKSHIAEIRSKVVLEIDLDPAMQGEGSAGARHGKNRSGNEPAPGAEEDGRVQFCFAGEILVVLHGPPGEPAIWAWAGERPASKATEAVVASAAERVRFLVI